MVCVRSRGVRLEGWWSASDWQHSASSVLLVHTYPLRHIYCTDINPRWRNLACMRKKLREKGTVFIDCRFYTKSTSVRIKSEFYLQRSIYYRLITRLNKAPAEIQTNRSPLCLKPSTRLLSVEAIDPIPRIVCMLSRPQQYIYDIYDIFLCFKLGLG